MEEFYQVNIYSSSPKEEIAVKPFLKSFSSNSKTCFYRSVEVLKFSKVKHASNNTLEFTLNSRPTLTQLVWFVKLAKFVQLAYLAQFDKFVDATDRKIATYSSILVCSNLTNTRNQTFKYYLVR